MFCSHCGQQALTGTRFCTRCGAEIAEVPPSAAPPQPASPKAPVAAVAPTPAVRKRPRVWPVTAALAAVTVVAAGGFTAYRAMSGDGQLARDGREVHGVVASISGPPTQQWSVSAADLIGPECETSPSTGDSPCSLPRSYDVGSDAPLLVIAAAPASIGDETNQAQSAMGIDPSTGKRLWRSSESWDRIQCAAGDAGQALCMLRRDGQVTIAWLDAATGALNTVRTQALVRPDVQVFGADGYLLTSQGDDGVTTRMVSVRKIDPAGAVVWTWSAAASVEGFFPTLYRWDGQLHLADTSVNGRPVVIDDRTGTASSATGAQNLPAGTIVGLHNGEPIVRDENKVLRIGGRQIGAAEESVETLLVDDGRDALPLLTSQSRGDNDVLMARDPYQPERVLWSTQNAFTPIWCGGTLVLDVRHSSPDASAGDRDFRWTAVDPQTGAVRWKGDRTQGPTWAGGGYCDGATLVTGDAGGLEARELATGRVLWTTPIGGDSFGDYLFGARQDRPQILLQGERITSLSW